MLDLLRQNTRSYVIYGLFAIIIVVFVFTFNTITPTQACGGDQPQGLTGDLAEVGGAVVDRNLFNAADELTVDPPSPTAADVDSFQRRYWFKNLRFALLPSYGFTSKYPEFGISPQQVGPLKPGKVMQDLIEHHLLVGQAEDTGLEVSSKEIADRLITDNWFDEDTGEFRRRDWEQTIRGTLGTSPTRFERFIGRELLREKYITLLVAGIDATSQEIAFYNRVANEKVNFEFIDVPFDQAADLAPVSDSELSTWLAANQDGVSKYYDDNPSDFRKEERLVVRGIQFKAPNQSRIEGEEDPTKKASMVNDRDTARASAETVLAELKALTVTQGSEETGDLVEAVIPMDAFAAKAKEASTFADNKETGGLFTEAKTKKDFEKYPFGEGADKALFELKAGQMSEILEVPSGYWIVRVDEVLPEEVKTLDQVRNDIAKLLIQKEKSADFAKAIAEDILAEAKKDTTRRLSDVATTINGKYVPEGSLNTFSALETGDLGRAAQGAVGSAMDIGRIPGIGEAPDLLLDAFEASSEAPLLPELYQTKDGDKYIVARWLSFTEAPALEQDEEQALIEQVRQLKQRLFYQAWYQELLNAATDDGDIDYAGEWDDMLEAARESYAEAGGVLPGAAPDAEAPQGEDDDEAQGADEAEGDAPSKS